MAAYRADDFTIRATTIVRVRVTRNEYPPVFTHGNLEITISENQPLGVSILRVNATDDDAPDGGVNGEFSFSINPADSIPANSHLYFFINPETGVLAVSSNLRDDPDRPTNYQVRYHFPLLQCTILFQH